jgi:D-amino-acid dehydrogenase
MDNHTAMTGTSGPRALILGGGIVGLACARELLAAGFAVTVVDRGRIGGACSHGNCGYVCPSHVLPLAAPGAISATLRMMLRRNSPVKMSPGEVVGHLGWFRRFARLCTADAMHAAAVGIQALLDSSRTLYDDLIAETAIDCDWQTDGLLFVYRTAEGFEHYAAIDAMLRDRYGRGAESLSADALVAREPALRRDALSGGFHYHCDAQLRPDKLTHGLANWLRDRHVEIIENTSFTGFDGAAVLTSAGPMTADIIIVAAGAYTAILADILGVAIPIRPGKGYSITMPRPAGAPRLPMIFEEDRVAVSPFSSGYRIGSMMEFVGFDESIPAKRLTLLTDTAKRYLIDPVAEPILESWTGFRPMIPDGKPIIDRLPHRPNVWITAGHGMLGLSMATGTARLVRELITGTTPHIDPGHYSLSRFA